MVYDVETMFKWLTSGLGERKTQKEKEWADMQKKKWRQFRARFIDRIAWNIMEHSLCDIFKAELLQHQIQQTK